MRRHRSDSQLLVEDMIHTYDSVKCVAKDKEWEGIN